MSENRLLNLFRPEILSMSAYHVPDASQYIKLDAMENPYSWPEDLQLQWLEHLKSCPLNRYPDPEARMLADVIRTTNDIPDTSALILGNGSDEIIQILMMALAPTASILAPEPGFVMYRQIARSLDLSYHGVPLVGNSFELDLVGMLSVIEREQPALIFLAYPNNPTGNLFDTQAIQRILNLSKGLVVIDEAYAPFADSSFIHELPHHDNLLVMRTLSKLGLAGLRLGFLAGPPHLIEQFNKIRLPYNINCLTQATASFALHNSEFLLEQTQLIRQQRTALMSHLSSLHGIEVYPSSANFILIKTEYKAADTVFASLKRQGILIKNLSPQGGLLANCLRITIGKPEENQAFLSALEIALRE